jgi:hypothetical protein
VTKIPHDSGYLTILITCPEEKLAYTVIMKRKKELTKSLLAGLIVFACAFSVTQSKAENIDPSEIREVKVTFSQSEQILEKQGYILEKIYLEDAETQINLEILANFDSKGTKGSFLVTHLPSGRTSLLFIDDEGKQLSGSLIVEKPSIGENSLLIKKISEPSDLAKESNVYFYPFEFQLLIDKNTVWTLLLETLREKLIIVMLVILVLTYFIYHSKRASLNTFTRKIVYLLIFSELLALLLFFTQSYLQKGVESGLILQERNYRTTQSTALSASKKTLTKLDENGSLEASLAVNWSNISPLIWEFTLSEMLNTQTVTSEIQERSKIPAIAQLLSSVSEIIATPSGKIQFIMNTSDPLLAHKLTQIEIQSAIDPDQSMERSSSSSSISFNDEQFISERSDQLSLDQQKKLIAENQIDILVEPNPGLWPLLFQKEYQILPEVNSISISLLLNRNHQELQDMRLISKLRNTLQSGAVLQTSYFQYGQLASQFASPGVTGYDPELGISSPSSIEQTEAKSEEDQKENQALMLRYPETEEALAKVIVKETLALGLTLESESYKEQDLEKLLLEDNTDLLLLEYDFILGDLGPFLDVFVDSSSSFNNFYKNERVDELIRKARRELNQYERIQMLQEIMRITVLEDPLGIPLLYKRSFSGQKKGGETEFKERIIDWLLTF